MGTWKPPSYYNDSETYPQSMYRPPWKYGAKNDPWFFRFERIAKHVRSDDDVLDLGCGSGLMAAFLYHAGHRGSYTGFDFASERIKSAIAGNQDGHPRASFAVRDLENEDISAAMNSATIIMCCETLEHLRDDIGFIQSWPSGKRFVISVPTFDTPSHLRKFNVKFLHQRYDKILSVASVSQWGRRHQYEWIFAAGTRR